MYSMPNQFTMRALMLHIKTSVIRLDESLNDIVFM